MLHVDFFLLVATEGQLETRDHLKTKQQKSKMQWGNNWKSRGGEVRLGQKKVTGCGGRSRDVLRLGIA